LKIRVVDDAFHGRQVAHIKFNNDVVVIDSPFASKAFIQLLNLVSRRLQTEQLEFMHMSADSIMLNIPVLFPTTIHTMEKIENQTVARGVLLGATMI
jgi:hypothetical protein